MRIFLFLGILFLGQVSYGQGASILMNKSLISVIETGDSITFNFQLTIENNGDETLDRLRVRDVLPFPIGSKVITPGIPTTGTLIVNPAYDGDTDINLITNASGNASTLDPGGSFTVGLVITVGFDDYYTTPKPIINSATARGRGSLGNVNDTDQLTILFEMIQVTKELSDFMYMGDSVRLDFHIEVVNTGTEDLDTLRIFDEMPFSFGSKSIVITEPPTSNLMVNDNYDGINVTRLITNSSGNMSILQCRDTIEVDLSIKVHKDTIKLTPKPLVNRVIARGDNPAGELTRDIETINLYIPHVSVTKSLSDVIIMGDSVEFTFDYELINCGSDTLRQLRLNDKLPFVGGSNVITVGPASEGVIGANTATPYDGNGLFPLDIKNNLLNTFSGGASGTLYPGDELEVQLRVKTHILDYVALGTPLFNTASGSGRGTQSLSQASDASDDRTPDNPDLGTDDDPTPLPLLPAADMRKTLEDFVINGDSVKFTFRFVVENTGNDVLDRIRIGDRLPFTGGTNMITILEQPDYSNFLVNPDFTGNEMFITSLENDLFDTFSDQAGHTLNPGDSVVVSLMVNASLCMYNNLMVPSENPARATVDGVTTDLRVTDEDFAELPPLPGLTLNKSIARSPAPVADDEGLFTATILLELRNSGNTYLSDIEIIEDLAAHYGCAFVEVTGPPLLVGEEVTGTTPTINGTYTGKNADTYIIQGSGLLAPGDSMAIEITVVIDPRCDGVSSPLVNSSYASAAVTDDMGTTIPDYFGRSFDLLEELSDDHTDFDIDMVPDNDTGEKDDATILYLPNLAVTKAFIDQEKLMDDDLLLTFEYEIRNTGNATIDSLTLMDPIEFFPDALGDTPGVPSIMISNIDANALPVANGSWDGYTDLNLFDGISGELDPGQSFSVTLTFEIDPYAYTAIQPQPRLNQATISGLPKNSDDAPILNPLTGLDYVDGDVSDLSDDGTDSDDPVDPLSDNPGADGNGLGDNEYDDPTPVNICKTYCEVEARKVTHISLGGSCMLEITASMVGVDIEPYCDYYYTVNLFDIHMVPLGTTKVDASHLGDSIIVQIIEPECDNVSWGKALIEDKLDPVVVCEVDTISCTMVLEPRIVPEATDNCGATVELRGEIYIDMPCDDEVLGRYERRWVAVDAYGNESEECLQLVYVERFDFTGLQFPPSHVRMDALECNSGYDVDSEGNPHPSETGFPVLHMGEGDPVPLYPFEAGEMCNGYVEYTDKVRTDPLGCVTTIERHWVVGEWWCSQSNEMLMVQMIELRDTRPPMILTCPDDMTISTDSRSCSGTVVIPPVTFTDACTDVHVNMQTPRGTLLNTNGAALELEAGMHTITFEVVDACHNMNTCEVNVLVVDEKSPVAICEQDLIASLNSNGNARILAEDFNLDSFDDCSDTLTYEVRRMDDPCGVSGTDWGDEVHFCCEDVGNPVMVAFRVTDESGNTNMCMVEVEVQDKRTARFDCIDNVVITCSETYAMNNLAAYFGMPTISDNCPANNSIRETSREDVNQCGIGSIHREFFLLDAAGSVVDYCEQWITITGEINITEDNIDWPDDFEIDGACQGSGQLHPDNLPDSLAYPEIPDGFCNQIGFKWDDEVYDATTGSEACFKIIRKWKVVDWCKESGTTSQQVFPTWEWEQIIKVFNTTAPAILSDCRDTVFQTFDCDSLNLSLGLLAQDDCTPFEDLLITYEIDEGDDGDIDQSAVSDSVKGKFGLGVHRIYWEVLDRCGQIARCDYTFEVRSMKAATPICLDGISVDLIAMDMDPMIPGPDTAFAILTPDMIDGKSEAPCDYDIQLSFSSDVNDTERVLTCADVGDYDIALWVTASNGAQSYCETTIKVTANDAMANGLCTDMNRLVTIEGNISTMTAQNMEGVEVELKGSELPLSNTGTDGMYAFHDITTGGKYEVVPSKDDDHLNGVSTLDIVMITRHVLGIDKITSPLQMIAADVNNNGSISASDIIELRKVILGHYEDFPSNTSWRFVDSGYSFVNPAFPWDEEVAETYQISDLIDDMNIDFIGVKTGDISGDASAKGRVVPINDRDRSVFTLKSAERFMKQGETFNTTFTVTEDVMGWQFEMMLEGLEVIAVNGAALGLNDSHVYVGDELLRMSVNQPVEAGSEFTISLKANVDGYISEMISVISERFTSEAYLGEEMQQADIVLDWMDVEGKGTFAIEQNIPNPWLDQTILGFTTPEDGIVTLIVLDITGKLLKKETAFFNAGRNQFRLRNDEILASGVMIYEVIHNGEKLHKKMIKLR